MDRGEFERRSCLTKKRFAVEPPLPNMNMRAYPCEFCNGWHLATKVHAQWGDVKYTKEGWPIVPEANR
jgi:hypothetical protein